MGEEGTENKGCWKDRPVLVTGGASFIASHPVDTLIFGGAETTVAVDLSSGKLGNLVGSLSSIDFVKMGLEYCGQDDVRKLFSRKELVFRTNARLKILAVESPRMPFNV